MVRDKATGDTRPVRARYVVVADGANSRFGRALGTTRDRSQPMGMALRGYYTSPGHDQPFIESHLDIRDDDGKVVPGYGWIFPLGDGRVNVGVGLLSTDKRWKGVNTSTLMEHFVAWAPKEWELSPATCLGPPTGGKLPMGLAVGPRVGATTLVVGDAAGSINPFNGEGIAYGYETGRMAAASLGEALRGDGAEALDRYEARLEDAYGLYYRVARAFIRMISRPELMQLCVGTGMHSESLMSWILRIMANLLRPDETGPGRSRLPRPRPHRPGHPRRGLSRGRADRSGPYRLTAWATRGRDRVVGGGEVGLGDGRAVGHRHQPVDDPAPEDEGLPLDHRAAARGVEGGQVAERTDSGRDREGDLLDRGRRSGDGRRGQRRSGTG